MQIFQLSNLPFGSARFRQTPKKFPPLNVTFTGGPCDLYRLRLRYVGRVQGVSFRSRTIDLAETLSGNGYNVTGFVINNADETVTVEIQGTEGMIRKYWEQAEIIFASDVESIEPPLLIKINPSERGFWQRGDKIFTKFAGVNYSNLTAGYTAGSMYEISDAD